MVSEIRFYFLLSNISFEDIVNLIDSVVSLIDEGKQSCILWIW